MSWSRARPAPGRATDKLEKCSTWNTAVSFQPSSRQLILLRRPRSVARAKRRNVPRGTLYWQECPYATVPKMGRRGFDWNCGRVLQGTCETSPAPPFDFASGQVFQRRGAGLTPFPSRLGTAEMPAPCLTSIGSQACLRYARFYLSAPASEPCPERSREVAGYCQ